MEACRQGGVVVQIVEGEHRAIEIQQQRRRRRRVAGEGDIIELRRRN